MTRSLHRLLRLQEQVDRYARMFVTDGDGHALGQFLGYPACCISAFPAWTGLVDKGEAGDECWPLCGTGFVPCKEHRTWDEAALVALIDEQRVCPLPFARLAKAVWGLDRELGHTHEPIPTGAAS